jgi:ubiquinone biosynthesis protein
VRTLRHEAPFWAATLPQLPRLVHRALAEDRLGALHVVLERIAQQNARRNRLLAALIVVVAVATMAAMVAVWQA